MTYLENLENLRSILICNVYRIDYICVQKFNAIIRITVDLDDELVRQAKEFFPDKTISEIVNLALLQYLKNFKEIEFSEKLKQMQ